MSRALGIAFGVVLGLLAAVPVLAGQDESRAWFEAMPDKEREGLQYDLTLLGYYQFIIDRQYGTGTYDALVAYQRDQGLEPDGVLDEAERQTLFDLSDVVYTRLGMETRTDEAGKSSLAVPAALLTKVTAYETGNTYATDDEGIALETLVKATSEISFSDLFVGLNSGADGFVVTDASYNASRFVISGKKDGRDYYTMYENADTESVGYSLSWTPEYAADAAIIKIFIASYFVPLKFIPAPENDKASSPTINAFGSWSLPAESPDVIALNGEISDTLVSDFERAVEQRPDAKVLTLNSPGGYVDYALVVAHKVRAMGMSTIVPAGMGCYSACSYIFFAGSSREVAGELGVHQISAEVADLVLAQTTLSDVLDALDEFQVEQRIISVMLKTPPEQMYVFNTQEIADLGINRGSILDAWLALPLLETQGNTPAVLVTPDAPAAGDVAYVMLSLRATEQEANESLKYTKDRFAGVLGDAVPEVSVLEGIAGTPFGVRVPASSTENANAVCAAIQSAGGGCYVTPAS